LYIQDAWAVTGGHWLPSANSLLTLSPAALGQLAQHFFDGKILISKAKKIGKIMYSTENHFSLICYFRWTLKKRSFIAVLHGFIGPTPKMLGQLLLCQIVS
jgi:hypothetical protein